MKDVEALDTAMAAIKALEDIDPKDDSPELAQDAKNALAALGRMRTAAMWTISFRPATGRDILRCDRTAEPRDGWMAVFVNGDLAAVADEYGTITLRAGYVESLSADAAEDAVRAVTRVAALVAE